MRLLRRLTVGAVAAFAIVPAVAASAAQAASPTPLKLVYSVKNMPPGSIFSAQYASGVDSTLGGEAQAQSGALGTVALLSNGIVLAPTGSSPTSASVTEWLNVGSQPITGFASVPSGATATVTNETTNQKTTITQGPFSIPTGAGALGGARPPAGGTKTINCKGNANSCTATVPLAGGASNRKLIIKLTDTNLTLRSVTAVPKSSSGSYLLTKGRYALGGSEYLVTLNAVKANPKGSHLVLKFAK